MSPERIVTETSGPSPSRRGPGGLDPAVGVFVAILLAALIGLLIWFFANRSDNTDNDGGSGNPAPHSTSQQQDNTQPSEEPSSASTP